MSRLNGTSVCPNPTIAECWNGPAAILLNILVVSSILLSALFCCIFIVAGLRDLFKKILVATGCARTRYGEWKPIV